MVSSIISLTIAIAILFTREPLAFGQTESMPKPPVDIAGGWVLELRSKFGACTGPIAIGPAGDFSADSRVARYAITCDGDTTAKQLSFDITHPPDGRYHFVGNGAYPDIFDLQWTQDGSALAGSGTFANQPLSAAMHK
jgi:hypothetical protein